ncbi:PKD domain-containing protein [Fulvivirga lutea]|uniref:PKD domain-containing protein n=1 Tax=Fulvivirga lutea TaxID=2810512 RepID=A0A974ZZN4_9BACT|nr:PKD domain-containing protein [Fulvivirga lutea]QSE96325.1 PKD domain-containing protein [Fulvivirga lutea]
MKYLLNRLFIAASIFVVAACSNDDDFPVPQASTVDVEYSFSIDNEAFAPATVTFTNETRVAEGKTATFNWSFGDGTSSSEENPTHFYESPGSYTVTLTAVTEDDLDFVEKTVVIKDPDALLTRLFVIDAADLLIGEVNGGSFGIDGFGTGIEYDSDNELIYYTDAEVLGEGKLWRVNLDGSDAEIVAEGFEDPRDVALDLDNNKAYITDRGAGVHAVHEIDLSSGNSTVLYDNANDGLGELPVGIDFYDNNLYITCVEIDAESVWVGNTDGSGVTRIIDYNAGGYGYGIAVDKVNEKIYFDDTDTGNILMANLDGSGIQTVIATGNRVYGLVVDNTNGKLYYSERNSGSVFMINLDGSDKVTLSSDFNDPRGLFFIP